jgi:hypothetical protein
MVKSLLIIGGGIKECYGTTRNCTNCTKILTFYNICVLYITVGWAYIKDILQQNPK